MTQRPTYIDTGYDEHHQLCPSGKHLLHDEVGEDGYPAPTHSLRNLHKYNEDQHNAGSSAQLVAAPTFDKLDLDAPPSRCVLECGRVHRILASVCRT